MNKSRNFISWFVALSFVALALFIANLWFGSVLINWGKIFQVLFHPEKTQSTAQVIVLSYRLPMAVTALATGIILSLSGLVLQTLFRNPLAGPSVLGISSGASLGVALVVLSSGLFHFELTTFPLLNNLTIIVAAFAGALFVLAIILVVSARVGNVITVLIIGIMLGYAVSALVSVLQFFSRSAELHAYVLWGLGSFSKTTILQSVMLLVTAMAGWGIVLFFAKPLNALLMGESYARSIGIPVQSIQRILILLTGLLVAIGTAFTGPIAFLGLAVPHLARALFKTSQHNILIPGTAILGANLALLCNLIAKMPGYDISLPINAVTSLIGAPVIIWVIIKSRHIKF